MKKLFLLLLLAPTLLHAQLAKSFEGTRPDIQKPIASLLLGPSAALQRTDTISETEYKFTYTGSDNKASEITMQKTKDPKTAADFYSITNIKGSFSLLFPFWKQHFEPDANEKATMSYEHANAYGLKKPDGHEKVFTFGKIEHATDWEIKIKQY